jgi:hypothetical protein
VVRLAARGLKRFPEVVDASAMAERRGHEPTFEHTFQPGFTPGRAPGSRRPGGQELLPCDGVVRAYLGMQASQE